MNLSKTLRIRERPFFCVSFFNSNHYAQPYPNAATLYYGLTSSGEGEYWKDYTQSPETENGFETIVFNVPLDLRAVNYAVNFYQGDAPNGVDGEVRVSVNGQTYSSAFHIDALEGNHAQSMEEVLSHRVSQPESILLNIENLVTGMPL